MYVRRAPPMIPLFVLLDKRRITPPARATRAFNVKLPGPESAHSSEFRLGSFVLDVSATR